MLLGTKVVVLACRNIFVCGTEMDVSLLDDDAVWYEYGCLSAQGYHVLGTK